MSKMIQRLVSSERNHELFIQILIYDEWVSKTEPDASTAEVKMCDKGERLWQVYSLMLV